MDPQTLYDLGRAWYRGRLDDDWTPLTVAEKTQILADHGLVGEFWSLV
jgi:hypothetical protein